MARALALLVCCAWFGCQESSGRDSSNAGPTAADSRPAAAAASPSATGTSGGPGTSADAGAPAEAADPAKSCIDGWLAAHKLNTYGDPAGTMYPGGTPLFDERTGQRRDRLEYARSKNPALGKACAPGKDGG